MTKTKPETEPRIETPYTNADDAPWRARLASAVLGPPARHGGLCLYPLLGDEGGAAPYLLLDAALAAGTLTIEEADGGGTVPALVLTNTGDARVLLLDGEELVGAKQNRIVNTSVLVGAHSRLSLPVTCVEAGRWRQESERFSSGRSHYNARGRQKKVAEVSASLARSGRAEADQSRVWSDIGGKLARLSVASETSALHDVARSYGTDLAGYAEALATPRPRQVGAAFALGRELVGVDLFDRADTLATVLPKLVASYALKRPGGGHPGCAAAARRRRRVAPGPRVRRPDPARRGRPGRGRPPVRPAPVGGRAGVRGHLPAPVRLRRQRPRRAGRPRAPVPPGPTLAAAGVGPPWQGDSAKGLGPPAGPDAARRKKSASPLGCRFIRIALQFSGREYSMTRSGVSVKCPIPVPFAPN